MGGRGGSSSSSFGSLTSREKELVTGKVKARGDFYIAMLNNDEGFYNAIHDASLREKIMRNNALYNNIVINTDLPKLTGTPKQIAYAESLRQRQLVQTVNSSRGRVQGFSQAEKELLIKQANQHGVKAKSISDVVEYKLRHKHSFLFSETSASKVIDKIKNSRW